MDLCLIQKDGHNKKVKNNSLETIYLKSNVSIKL